MLPTNVILSGEAGAKDLTSARSADAVGGIISAVDSTIKAHAPHRGSKPSYGPSPRLRRGSG
ncbi:MAG TPA: hypothetical protein VMH04_15465 [Candidatus Solibacter sp.]|nr:hypothetical protein [Candidatus Solibacter sp.]